jgi:hypothetical protein
MTARWLLLLAVARWIPVLIRRRTWRRYLPLGDGAC